MEIENSSRNSGILVGFVFSTLLVLVVRQI